MFVLGIETSCDDTAAAVVEHGPRPPRLVSSIVAVQDVHREFGGVVPELASRAHLELLPGAVERALAEAELDFDAIDGIAVTRAPGLLGALLVGVSYAKALAVALEKPFVGVNHIEAHLLAPLLEGAVFEFPAVGAVVSGGHSEIFLVHALGAYTLIGTTRDDAIGEAFDKAAKLLGLGFPGGPVVDRLAAVGDAGRHPLPRGMSGSGDLDLSYSGLKAATRRLIEGPAGALLRAAPESDEAAQLRADICASFQVAAVDPLLSKLETAARRHGARSLVVGGGVACNSRLREGLAGIGTRLGIPAFRPSPALCADNAAMIALVGGFRLARGERDGLDLEPVPSLDESGMLSVKAPA